MPELKQAASCYRTYAGVRWGQWLSDPPADFVAALRTAGVRCKVARHRDGGRELYVHPDDRALASEIDRKQPGAECR